MFPMTHYCYVCNDVKRYNRAVDDVTRICAVLRDLIPDNIQSGDKIKRNTFLTDRKHIHFACGQCPNAGNTLRIKEDELKRLLEKAFAYVISLDKPFIYQNILHLLQGHYPQTYHVFEREYKQKKGEINV